MNNLRNAMLKAGLITPQEKLHTEYEKEILHLLHLHERSDPEIAHEDNAHDLAKAAELAGTPFDKLNGFVMDAIPRLREFKRVRRLH